VQLCDGAHDVESLGNAHAVNMAHSQAMCLQSTLAFACLRAGVPLGPQISKLNRGCDVVVGTPGRIIDLIENSGALKLSQVRRA